MALSFPLKQHAELIRMGYINIWSNIGLLNVAATLKFWLPNTKLSVIP